MPKPAFGWTRGNKPVHARTIDHLPSASRADRFNRWLAIRVTSLVGSMWCAYVFAAITLVSLPAAISSHSVLTIIAWIAQTFLQLVLLSVIMVGQNVQSAASDARAAKTFEDTEKALDLLDVRTADGLGAVMDALKRIDARLPPGAG